MKLRIKIWVCLVIISLAVVGCAPGGEGSNELSILEWEGYDNPDYWKGFAEKNPAVNVKFTIMEDDPESLSKMQAHPSLDLAHPCANYWGLLVEEHLVQPIDTSRLEHLNQLAPELLQMGYFEGQLYFIPWDWGYEGIAYRADLVDNPPTRWADLWNSEYQGRVSIADVGENAFMVSALSIGMDPYFPSPNQKRQIKYHLKDLEESGVQFWEDDQVLNEQMAKGEIWVAGNAWNSTFLQLKEQGVAVEYVLPAEGAIGWVCGFGITRETRNLDLVYDYLNAIMTPEANAAMANDYGYGPANRQSIALMNPDVVSALGLDRPNLLSLMNMMLPLTREQLEEYVDTWAYVRGEE